MKFTKFICAMAIATLLSVAAFAMPPGPNIDTGTPAVERSAPFSLSVATFDVAAIQADADRNSVPAFEVAISPPDIAVEVASVNTANRTATVPRTNQLRADANTSPPSDHNGKLVGQPFDAENAYVPLGSPKPVEATARSGSFT
jgi:hypothetical protein